MNGTAGSARYEQLLWDLMCERQGPVVHEFHNARRRVDTMEEIAKRRSELVAATATELHVVRDGRVAS